MFKDSKEYLVAAGTTLIAGTLAKLHDFFPAYFQNDYFERNVPAILLVALSIVFYMQGRIRLNAFRLLLVLSAVSFLFINLLPGNHTQTFELSTIHLPVFLWCVIGLAYQRNKSQESQMAYISFNGEMLMIVPIFLIGGLVFSFFTMVLLKQTGIEVSWLIGDYVALYGSIGSVLAGAILIEKSKKLFRPMAPVMARLFTPLFLLFLVTYLFALIIQPKNPAEDRDFLIMLNMLLIVILGIAVFSISGRKPSEGVNFLDFINFALACITVIVNGIVLSAVIVRLASFGLTPNRIAAIGANILIFVNLVGICIHYGRFFRKTATIQPLEVWICRYLPVYTLWSGLVTFGFPFIFQFR